MSEKKPLYSGILELMAQRAHGVISSHQAEKDLVEFGTLLSRSQLLPTEVRETVRLLGEIRDKLSATGDERNARAYLTGLIQEFEPGPEPASTHLGRTA